MATASERVERPNFKERCQAEITRDVIFLLQWKSLKRQAHWNVEGVFLSREEAEVFRKSHEYRWPFSRVYGVCAEGELAQLISNT